jgi:hypothetical protein
LLGDKAVTQTCHPNNLNNETSLKRPSEEGNIESLSLKTALAAITTMSGKRSADVARNQAERRWTSQVHELFGGSPITYGEVIEAITKEIRAAATDAELASRGSGLRYILKTLKLGDGR